MKKPVLKCFICRKMLHQSGGRKTDICTMCGNDRLYRVLAKGFSLIKTNPNNSEEIKVSPNKSKELYSTDWYKVGKYY